MTKLQAPLILATFMAVLLLKSACLGLERNAQDYLIPFLRTKGLDPLWIKGDALCFERVFETHFVGESLQEMKNFLDYFGDKLWNGIYHKQPENPSYSAEKYKGPRLRFVGLTNDDFNKTWKLDSPKIDLDGRSNVLVEICNILDPLRSEQWVDQGSQSNQPDYGQSVDQGWQSNQPDYGNSYPSKEKVRLGADLDRWLKFAQIYISLYDIPEDDAITIYETGMRFGSSKSNQPRSRLFHYIKHFASHISQYLGPANYSMTHYETHLDYFFANRENKTSIIDKELRRIAFKVDLKESSNSVRASTESDRSVIGKVEWYEQFSASRCPPELRKSLENSVGFFTLAMGLAPAEVRKIEGLDFGFAKRIEYLRICNQLDQR